MKPSNLHLDIPTFYTPLDVPFTIYDTPESLLIRKPSNLCVSCSEDDVPKDNESWPNDTCANLFQIILKKNKSTLGDFLKECICLSRKNKQKLSISWPDFCVLALRKYSISHNSDIQRPDVWRDRMFILSLISSLM